MTNWTILKLKEIICLSKKQEADINVNELADVYSSVYSDQDLVNMNLSDLLSSPLIITQSDVYEVLRSLKKGSPGPDSLPFWVFRDNSLLFSGVIASLFNKCFRLGHFPSVFKCADVIPIAKL